MQRTRRYRALPFLLPTACGVLVLTLLMVVRLERDAASYLRTGDEHSRRGEPAEAFFAWKMSLSMYVPFSRTPHEAAYRLWKAGEEAFRKGDPEEALRAFRQLRAGLLAIRHVVQPMPDILARTEDRMASLLPGGDPGARARQLNARHGTSSSGYLFLIIGVPGWPASMLHLFWRWRRGEKLMRLKMLAPPMLFLMVLLAGVLLS